MSCVLPEDRSNWMACGSMLLGIINWQGSVWKVKERRALCVTNLCMGTTLLGTNRMEKDLYVIYFHRRTLVMSSLRF